MKRIKPVHCPNCGRRPAAPHRNYRTADGVRINHYRCACGCRFKSFVRPDPPRPA